MADDDSPEKPVGDPEGEGGLPPKSETLGGYLFKRLSAPIQFGKPETPQPEQPESSLDPQWRESFERVRQCNDSVSRELAMRAEVKNFPEFKLSEYRKLYELWDKKLSAVDQLFPTRKWIANTPFWKWTGIGEKKGWDILQLLIAPVLIAAIGFGLQRYFTTKDAEQLKAEQQRNQLIAESKAKQDRQMADDKAKQETLVRYLDQMATSLDRKLLEAKPGDKEFIIAQARTVIVLQSLDSKRQHLVIQYLQAAGLNQANNVQVDKNGKAQLEKGDKVLMYQAQMEKANLKESDLSGVVLISANLSSADLRSANLSSANLSSADLYNANLSHANLRSADLNYANLLGANLRSADLYSIDISRADIRYAKLSSADLNNANLSHADFSSADLRSANFRLADLSSAKLSSADLSHADLSSAKLEKTNLSSADLSSAILFEVDLTQLVGSNFSFEADNLTQQQLEGENPPLLCIVKLPKGIKVDPNRDCERLPEVLQKRYPDDFKTLKDAQDYVKERMRMVF